MELGNVILDFPAPGSARPGVGGTLNHLCPCEYQTTGIECPLEGSFTSSKWRDQEERWPPFYWKADRCWELLPSSANQNILGPMQTHQATVVYDGCSTMPLPPFFALEVMFWETEKNVLGWNVEKKKGREEINFIAKVTWKILEELKTVLRISSVTS